jgi:multidrug efflux pump subunit AcrA (membrane-fusion protein)
VDEQDIAMVKTGQTVLIKLELDKNKIYKAVVSKIYPKLNEADQSFRVDAVFGTDQPPILYGLTIEANIVISSKPKTLTIPKTALVSEDSVVVKTSDGDKKIRIQRGLENMEYTEIISGLDEKSEIVVKKK